MNIKSPKKMAGVALIEATIVLPFLFLLMLACVEGGRYLYSYNTLSKLTRDAARFLSDRAFEGTFQSIDLNNTKIEKVKNFVVYGNPQGTGSPLLINFDTSHITVTSSGAYVIVESNYPYTTVFGNSLTLFGYGNDLDFSGDIYASVTMRAVN